MGETRRRVVEIVGIYHAEGSLLGEVRYALGRMRGTAHCALCDITHGALRRKRSWDAYVAGLGVPVRLLHLDEMPDDVASSVARTGSPVVLGRTPDDDLVTLLDADALEVLQGDVDAFAGALARALEAVAR
ncbi:MULTISPECIES: hypothetical protein [unclassified Isoptericola]|uniref:hypothetical protein n=1 Tax=unclassified Isoptericola TaxID=2623355 RepID=UPI0027136709|nr:MULTISPECIES: hypothetical protein [unclassified Isoptericola]MDO8143851.1 hypothetical protein [Isoptericola sp. 178]MDO8149275.1 hypothetical protein [Isoptericola sp. b515]MDO8152214.1 hypothetical protein [Isoptericola sp. b408]